MCIIVCFWDGGGVIWIEGCDGWVQWMGVMGECDGWVMGECDGWVQ